MTTTPTNWNVNAVLGAPEGPPELLVHRLRSNEYALTPEQRNRTPRVNPARP